MKKLIGAGLIAATMCFSAPALAHDRAVNDQYEDAVMHPLRLAFYAIHPIGYAAEWLIGRPYQYIISRPQLRNIFGWQPLEEEATYQQIGEQKL